MKTIERDLHPSQIIILEGILKPESELSFNMFQVLRYPTYNNIHTVISDYMAQVIELSQEKHLIEDDLTILHTHRYRINLSLWFYLLGIQITNDMRLRLRIHYTDAILKDYWNHIEFTEDIPTGDDIINIINDLILINQNERHIVNNVCNSIDSRGYISSNRDNMLIPLNSINEFLFYFHYTHTEVLAFTRSLFNDSDMKNRQFLRSHDFWNPSNFLILAYMGTNLEVPIGKRGKLIKRKVKRETTYAPDTYPGMQSEYADLLRKLHDPKGGLHYY